jgi:hypothetical protein
LQALQIWPRIDVGFDGPRILDAKLGFLVRFFCLFVYLEGVYYDINICVQGLCCSRFCQYLIHKKTKVEL